MRGCIAFFLFIFIVGPALFAFELVAGASTWLFNREFYSDVLATPEVYGAFFEGVVDILSDGAGPMRESGDFDRLAASVDVEEWSAALNSAVNQFFDVIEGKTTRVSININIPLAPLKALLESSVGEQFVRQFAQGLKACAAGQEPSALPPQVAGFPLPVCVPQNQTREAFVSGLIERLPSITANMPEYLTYNDTVDPIFTEDFSGIGISDIVDAMTAVVVVFGVVSVGLWFMTGLIGAGSARGRLLWLGGMLFLPSVVAALIGLGVAAATRALMMDSISANIDLNDSITQAVYNVMSGGANKVSLSFMAAGGIPSAVGILLFLVGLILPARRDDELQRDLFNNPTTQYGGKPKNDSNLYEKLKNSDKPKNDDSIIKPL